MSEFRSVPPHEIEPSPEKKEGIPIPENMRRQFIAIVTALANQEEGTDDSMLARGKYDLVIPENFDTEADKIPNRATFVVGGEGNGDDRPKPGTWTIELSRVDPADGREFPLTTYGVETGRDDVVKWFGMGYQELAVDVEEVEEVIFFAEHAIRKKLTEEGENESEAE